MDGIWILYEADINSQNEKTETGLQARETYAYNELYATLSKQQQRLFLEFLDLHDYVWSDRCAQTYRKGFQRGIRLLFDTLHKN